MLTALLALPAFARDFTCDAFANTMTGNTDCQIKLGNADNSNKLNQRDLRISSATHDTATRESEEPVKYYATGGFQDWNIEKPAEFTYSDGVYTLVAENASNIKISTAIGTWDDFDSATIAPAGDPYEDGAIPFKIEYAYEFLLEYEATWLVTIDPNKQTVRFNTVNPWADAELYLRGDMNNWEAVDEWKLTTTDGQNYTISNVTIKAEEKFKIGDALWGKCNFGGASLTDTIVPNTVATLVYNGLDLNLKETVENAFVQFNLPNLTLLITSSTADSNDFEYQGLWYTVLDAEAKTCRTKNGITGYDEEGTYYYLPGNTCSGDLIIPEIVSDGQNNYTVVEIGTAGFCSQNMTSVNLPNTVTSIGMSAFMYCRDMETIHLSNSLQTIGIHAFTGCSKITSIELPGTLKNLEWRAFECCTMLESINIPDGITKLEYRTFGECSSLTSLTLPESITSFESSVFQGCESLKSINLPIDLETIPDMTFDGCKSLESIDIPKNVKAIEWFAFNGCESLTHVILPEGLTMIDGHAFLNCNRLSSFIWQPHFQIPNEVTTAIGNPNLLVYVDNIQFAPADVDKNVVVMLNDPQHFECANLVLTPGYPFTPLYSFDAKQSSMTKPFTQKTPIDGCGGWDTLVLPFDVTDIVTYDGRHLTPFALMTDPEAQYPFWLCDADPNGEWNHVGAIKAGVPYIISMPNNERYRDRYCISGNVTFSNSETVHITPETTAPFSTTWASGRQFRSLWTPLTQEEAANAMGLNTGITGLTDNEGVTLMPGSAFHVGVVPQPLEAYVTIIDAQKAHRVIGNQSAVLMMPDDSDLSITGSYGSILIASGEDRTVDIYTPDGMLIRSVKVAAGETCTVTDLTKGIYIVANRKIAVK